MTDMVTNSKHRGEYLFLYGVNVSLHISLTNLPRNIIQFICQFINRLFDSMHLRSQPKQLTSQLLKQSLQKIKADKASFSQTSLKQSKTTIEVQTALVTNDGTRPSLKILTSLKNIISRQLPKMPRQYITKIIFDKKHQSIVATLNDDVVGGACFRCFRQQTFSELVFLAVQQNSRERGLGSQLINSLKETLQERKVKSVLTYADLSALGFFRKQAFEKTVDTGDKQWSGYIKAYEGGTLMECRIEGRFKYSQFRDIVKDQQKYVINQIITHFSNNETEYSLKTLEQIVSKKGTDIFEERSTENQMITQRTYATVLSLEDIPGVLESSWSKQREEQVQRGTEISDMLTQLYAVECIRKHSLSKIINSMLSNREIRLPVDFCTIEKKIIKRSNYTNQNLIQDLKSIPIYLKDHYSQEIEGIDDLQRKIEAVTKSLKDRNLVLPSKLEGDVKVRRKN